MGCFGVYNVVQSLRRCKQSGWPGIRVFGYEHEFWMTRVRSGKVLTKVKVASLSTIGLVGERH